MNPAVIALAVARLTTLVVEDEITRPVRERVQWWANGADEFSVRERLSTLLRCQKCVGIWSAAAVLAAARIPVLRPAVNVLAAAQAALAVTTILEKWDR